jgi:hypothetical protein
MADLVLTGEMIKWLKSYNWNPPFNEAEMFKLAESIDTLEKALPFYGSFDELDPDFYLNNLDKMTFQDPTQDDIIKIQYCVKNYNEWSKALTSIWEINQAILARTGTTFPFEFDRIKRLLDGLFNKLMEFIKSDTPYPQPQTQPQQNINFINVHSIPGIINEYSTAEKALLFHRKLVLKIGQGMFQFENIPRIVNMYKGENYIILHEVFFNAYQIEIFLRSLEHAQYKYRNQEVMFWLLQILEVIREKIEREYQLFHDTATFVLDALDPL